MVAGYQSIDDNVLMRFNSDTGSNYSSTTLFGNGSAASSFRSTSATSMQLGGLFTSDGGNAIYQIMNYSNSTTYKSVLARANAAGSGTQARVGLWRSTAAITSVTLLTGSGNFAVGSTFSLYGIASEAAGAKATGGYITSDAQYTYHTFFSTGTFTPKQSLTCDYLVVAGGGGGGSRWGGGGGAGGYRTGTGASVTANTPYTVTVGAGGAGGAVGTYNNGTKGIDSVFSTITSTGGGFGSSAGSAGGTGGSGGGGGTINQAGGAGNQGGYSPVEGYAGGSTPNLFAQGGGGGGAGAVGANAPAHQQGGAGGIGSNSVSTWATATGTGASGYYAGGGGGGGETANGGISGGLGGLGGGGRGGNQNEASGVAGTANTGGGGGGGANDASAGASGGSGIVIVRYAKA